jgi:uncharacterized membrane protein HdeD (DUF308 family)
MLDLFAKNWWVYIVRGAVALIFGLYAWFMPGLAMKFLLMFFGIFVLIEGVFTIVGSIAGRKASDVWWLVLLEGAAGLVIGLLTLTRPGFVATVIVIFIAVWAIWGGLFRIIAAIKLRKEIDSEWLLIFGGAVSILFGLMLFKHTGAGIVAVSWLIAFFARMIGVLLISFGIKARKFQKDAERAG